MRSRQEIKAIGKERFKAYRGPCIGASVLIMVVNALLDNYISYTRDVDYYGYATQVSFPLPLTWLITGPLAIGLCYFFVQLILGHEDEIHAVTPFRSAFSGYGRKVGGYLWMQLFTVLWSLLLVVPGIIKSFSYAMTPYILSDCPNVKATDALKLSMRIMDGRKADLFVFYLSFLGWIALSGLTFGLLYVFYVSPYASSALACWYLEAREEALQNGVITMGQLEGTEPV